MKMQFLAIVIVFIVFVVMQIAAYKKKKAKTPDVPPYIKKKSLLGEREQVLFHSLVEAMPGHQVMAQVRLADIVGVKKCADWQAWFNKVSRKSVDFVICDKAFVVLACIELDGEDARAGGQEKSGQHNRRGIERRRDTRSAYRREQAAADRRHQGDAGKRDREAARLGASAKNAGADPDQSAAAPDLRPI